MVVFPKSDRIWRPESCLAMLDCHNMRHMNLSPAGLRRQVHLEELSAIGIFNLQHLLTLA